MDLSGFTYVRLSPEKEILSFDCGDTDLNEFIVVDAQNYLQELLAVTYLFENDNDVVAFFSVLNDKILYEQVGRNNLWNKIRKNIPHKKHFKSYPAVKLGRLAVNKPYQKQHLGTSILDYIKVFFIDRNKTGCRFITVDAYRESLAFYEKNGFKYMTEDDKNSDTRLMYYDLASLKGLLKI
ncbi:MAG TPA: GNAT family N-acetyltransferase [Puia sp.]|uniref:GNAT family N-acetyltransferase n=1 Tax=Puia sp. TaxID=2045100 RepID=UPI002B87BED9|nr:GNAT family N-acetyltransferase [Puia sp.]HVU98883.1 GNAT family N-acetyltransferase [Puia sp.]